MSDTDIERVLEQWFDDGPTAMPDRVALVVADRIDRQRQRRPWRLDRRHPRMNSTIKVAAGIAAVVIVAVIGYNLLPSSSNVGVPTVSPSPSPVPSPSTSPSPSPSPSAPAIECANGTTGCLGPLAEGDYRTSQFLAPFGYRTVGDGWQNIMDTPASFLVYQDGSTMPIGVFTNLGLLDQPDGCGPTPSVHAAASAADVAAYLTEHPALDAGDAVPVQVGGVDGVAIDFSMAADWENVCTDADPANPSVALMGDTSPEPGRLIAYGPGQRARWIILEVRDRVIVIEQGTGNAALFDVGISNNQPVLDSIEFHQAT